MSKTPLCRFRAVTAPLMVFTVALLSPTASQAQQQVYRSVDAQGNVSFSAEPPTDANVRSVETLTLQPGPSEADRQAAEARARDIQQAAEDYDNRRKAAAEKLKSQEPTPPPSQAEQSPDAEQWNELLVNDRVLTPEQRLKVEQAKRELLKAEHHKQQQGSGGKDLYQRPNNSARTE